MNVQPNKGSQSTRQFKELQLEEPQVPTERPGTSVQSGLVLQPAAPATESVGNYLARERALRGLSLEELAQVTRIPVRMLQHLEADRFESLPSDVFVRGFLRAYARALGMDGDEVLLRYTEARRSDPPPPAILPPIAPVESGRRFGIAIALVILLILFTLALSIVLQPRHRDAPVELSQTHQPRIEWVEGDVASRLIT